MTSPLFQFIYKYYPSPRHEDCHQQAVYPSLNNTSAYWRIAEHLQQEYLVKLTGPAVVDLEPSDHATAMAHVARIKRENGNFSIDEDKDLDAEKHARAVKTAKKKAPFNNDQPATAYREDGAWEDVQLHAAWTAQFDKNNTHSLLVILRMPHNPPSISCKITPLSPTLQLLVETKRQIARSNNTSASPLSAFPIHHTTTVTHSSFARLDGWLNDEFVNKYINLLTSTLAIGMSIFFFYIYMYSDEPPKLLHHNKGAKPTRRSPQTSAGEPTGSGHCVPACPFKFALDSFCIAAKVEIGTVFQLLWQ